jgi:hypothetical protein
VSKTPLYVESLRTTATGLEQVPSLGTIINAQSVPGGFTEEPIDWKRYERTVLAPGERVRMYSATPKEDHPDPEHWKADVHGAIRRSNLSVTGRVARVRTTMLGTYKGFMFEERSPVRA